MLVPWICAVILRQVFELIFGVGAAIYEWFWELGGVAILRQIFELFSNLLVPVVVTAILWQISELLSKNSLRGGVVPSCGKSLNYF